jgi:hypothetical protein
MEENTQPAENEEVDADGYYGDDEVGDEELDLSFLDEEDDDDGAKDEK